MRTTLFYTVIFLIFSTTTYAMDPLMAKRIKILEQQLNDLKEEADYTPDMPGYEPLAENAIPTANLLSRITNIEESVRTLTGKTEENYHQLMQLRHQLEILIGDMEVRFSENETAIKTLMEYSTAKDKNTIAKDPNPSHLLEKKKSNSASAANSLASSSKETIKQQYLEAKAHYDAGHFPQAEAAFKAFIENNKKNEYSASAAFWLGKIYLNLGQPKKAAVAFKGGYTQHPESRRTAENLLGMAEALSKTNRKNACVTLESLQQDLPNRDLMDKEQIHTVQTKVNQLYKQLKCAA